MRQTVERIRKLFIQNTVLVQESALVLNGLTRRLEGEIYMYTGNKELDGIHGNNIEYFYLPDFDTQHDLHAMEGTTNVYLPTRERAIIDYYRYGRFDWETLLQAITDYDAMRIDHAQLNVVAEFYGVTTAQIDELRQIAKETLVH